MFKNLLKISFRNLVNNKAYTLVNIVGLALSMACSLVLLLLIDFEISFDGYHERKENIYRITQHMQRSDGIQYSSGSQYPMAKSLRNDFPDLLQVAMVEYHNTPVIRIAHEDGSITNFTESESVAFVEPGFLEIFDFEVIAGSSEQALSNRGGALVSESKVKKYFGLDDKQLQGAIGRTFTIDGDLDVIINGVIKDPPSNSDFPFHVITSFESFGVLDESFDLNNWSSTSYYSNCYFLAPDGFNISNFEDQLVPFINKYRGEGASELRKFIPQPLTDIHFDQRFGNYNARIASREQLWTMGAIALILIVVAAINFINLATAQSTKRSKEVGLRKIMGGTRKQLIGQFFLENLLVSITAGLLSLVIAELMIIYTPNLINLGGDFNLFTTVEAYQYLLLICLVVGALSGIYPAILISGLQPIRILNSRHSTITFSGSSVRRMLVVGQFVITQVLIIGTLVVRSQIDYFNNKPLGFDSDAHISFGIPQNDATSLENLRYKLLANPSIQEVTFTLAQPQGDNYFETSYAIRGESSSQENRTEVKPADKYFFNVLGLEFLAGKRYEFDDSAKSIVINRSMMVSQGYEEPSDIIGQKIEVMGERYPIDGVVENFHSRSLQYDMTPIVFAALPEFYYEGIVRLEPGRAGSLRDVIEVIQVSWEEVFPDELFKPVIMEDFLASRYNEEQRTANLFQVFTLIAIIVGVLGLHGLVSFMAVQKIKEIGIRKVLGARIVSIIAFFASQFLKLMAIAFLIAGPIGFILLSGWLNNFEHRISIQPIHFVIAASVSAVITCMAISYQSIKASLTNPVNSLRNE